MINYDLRNSTVFTGIFEAMIVCRKKYLSGFPVKKGKLISRKRPEQFMIFFQFLFQQFSFHQYSITGEHKCLTWFTPSTKINTG